MRRTRARRAVLSGVATFVVMQLALAALIAWGPWPFLRDPAFGYKAALLERRLAGTRERPYTVVLLGSSRTAWSVDTAALEPLLAGAGTSPSCSSTTAGCSSKRRAISFSSQRMC